jgi:hypothetical protein
VTPAERVRGAVGNLAAGVLAGEDFPLSLTFAAGECTEALAVLDTLPASVCVRQAEEPRTYVLWRRP